MAGPPSFVARARLRRSWRSHAGVAVLLAVMLGTALVSIAGARRTQSSYPRFLRSVRASTLGVGSLSGYDARETAAIAALPQVVRSRTYVGLVVNLQPRGRRMLTSRDVETLGTFDGRYFDQDRFTPTDGRAANPARRDEVVVNAFAASRFHLHPGQRLQLSVYSQDQIAAAAYAPATVRPRMRMSATLVGVGVFPDEVVQDDADRATRVLFTPAFTRWAKQYVTYSIQGLVLRRGHDDVDAVKRGVSRLVRDPTSVEFRVTADDVFHVQHGMRPMTTALAAFGGIVGIAGLVLVMQGLARLVREQRDQQRMLRALGCAPRSVVAAGVAGPAVAVLVGTGLAAVVATLVSPLMPIGPVRRVEVDRGFDVDVTTFATSMAFAAVVLLAFTIVCAARDLPDRRNAVRSTRSKTRSPFATTLAHTSVPAATGLRFAFSPSPSTGAASASVAFGGVIAMAALVAALVFGTSLHLLVREPRLYGWTADAAITSGQGYGNLPLDRAHTVLDADPTIAAWSGVYFGGATVDGRAVPLLGMDPGSRVIPAVIEGAPIAGAGEIVLGGATARALRKHVRDVVSFRGAGGARRLVVTGIATFPTIGPVHIAHTSLGVGALVAPELVPGADRDIFGRRAPGLGPNAIFVRYRDGAATSAALARLRARAAPLGGFAGLDVLPVQRPAEIVNSSQVGAAPVALGVALATGAAVSLALALGSTVRHRRRDLTLLRTLGCTRRQLSATVAWHATATTVAATVFGVPLGIVAGRRLWVLFAQSVDVVARPALPTRSLVAVVVGALAVANLVAAAPARVARNLDASTLLRAE